ncbi:MAG: hypothetical protein ACR65R_07675 [Methylomicrobium sp.]
MTKNWPAEALTSEYYEDLYNTLRFYGRKRFPSLREDADDLARQTMSYLWEYLERRPKDQPIDLQSVYKIAISIFRRRAVDMYRKSTKRWALDMESLSEAEQIDHHTYNAAKSDLYQKMLRICIAELTEVTQTDLALFALAAGIGPEPNQAMPARDRQRLHRLRKRLAAAIRRKLGEDVNTVLREDFLE